MIFSGLPLFLVSSAALSLACPTFNQIEINDIFSDVVSDFVLCYEREGGDPNLTQTFQVVAGWSKRFLFPPPMVDSVWPAYEGKRARAADPMRSVDYCQQLREKRDWSVEKRMLVADFVSAAMSTSGYWFHLNPQQRQFASLFVSTLSHGNAEVLALLDEAIQYSISYHSGISRGSEENNVELVDRIDKFVDGSSFTALLDQVKLDCPICLDSSREDSVVVKTPCNHDFHSDCIKKAMKAVPFKCPLCRRQLMKE